MPTYRITTGYSCPRKLGPDAEQTLAQSIEAAAVAQLRIASGEGHVPPTVADALTLLRAWYGAEIAASALAAKAVGVQL
jgi:hypothetical protein